MIRTGWVRRLSTFSFAIEPPPLKVVVASFRQPKVILHPTVHSSEVQQPTPAITPSTTLNMRPALDFSQSGRSMPVATDLKAGGSSPSERARKLLGQRPDASPAVYASITWLDLRTGATDSGIGAILDDRAATAPTVD